MILWESRPKSHRAATWGLVKNGRRLPVTEFKVDLDRFTANRMGITVEELNGRSHKAHIARGKHMVRAILYYGATCSALSVGRLLGVDHTTIISSLRRLEGLACTYPQIGNSIAAIERDLKQAGWEFEHIAKMLKHD